MGGVDTEFVFQFVESDDVMRLLQGIVTSKASGVDGINSAVLRDGLKICLLEFTYSINVSLSSGDIPGEWKSSCITLIPKDGSLKSVGNWRPINNVCAPCNILEKCVYILNCHCILRGMG